MALHPFPRRISLPVLRYALLAIGSMSTCIVVSCSDKSDESSEEKNPSPTDSMSSGGASFDGGGGTGAMGGDSSLGSGGTVSAGAGGEGGSSSALDSPPELLSATGLYEGDAQTLAAGVRPFEPQFPLWTDGATKERWIFLPEGETIDTSNMDFWSYPVGTKLWKEFTRDGVRVETRLLQKLEGGRWWMMAYLWREDQSDADAVPDGVLNAAGTEHDIPSSLDCATCHARVVDKVLGFTAMQLEAQGTVVSESDVTLADLVSEARLSHAPASLTLPWSAEENAALGYLHSNCASCHNGFAALGRVNMNLYLEADSLGAITETPTYRTTVGVMNAVPEDAPPAAVHRIVAGSLSESALFLRMNSRGEEYSMPPLGSEVTDDSGSAAVSAWIESL